MKGSNQTTVRDNNERLVLHLIRRHGAMTKAEATRETGLSPNAISVIFNALEEDGFLLRGERMRGRIGQPSTPLRLNPDARFHIGLKIGRRGFDMVVVDFCGGIRARCQQAHDYPTPERIVAFVRAELENMLRDTGISAEAIAGSGIAIPSQLWHWSGDFGVSQSEMDVWRDHDIAATLEDILPGPILVENDATAACYAEWVFGGRRIKPDSLYFFIGTFIGGGVVLDGGVFRGCRGNAGAFGPLRIPEEPGGTRLVDHASLSVLYQMLQRQGSHDATPFAPDQDWNALEPALSDWILRSARSLAHAVVSASAVIDFEEVIIDGAFPSDVRGRLARILESRLSLLDLGGIPHPEVSQGSFGGVARAMGAAAAHICNRYMIRQEPGRD
ncbi:ROK family transcriptional regulator [Roseinatronobacter alkalisoli]|uniref:ROK family transcriptional regulator n=1 Tax=Roseinatronobacter alkalisoli TaxID=3028235 RepID=A0ABT5TAY8_9RHOB|nr:ROK family transcriptional regulator [Roseinatronobacter sp. HJB301]MDD7972283.1 ROK family transcriptional regulator [Roseinatronobacter sp. HJB301]